MSGERINCSVNGDEVLHLGKVVVLQVLSRV